MAMCSGGLGVQYFVMGKTAAGLITILLTIVTCGLWEIVTLIQGIMMLCMTESDFKRKYIDSTSTLPLSEPAFLKRLPADNTLKFPEA